MRLLRQEWSFRRSLAALMTLAVMLAGLVYTNPAEAQRRQKPPKPFSITQADILDSENGYPIPLDSDFFPGETVHLRFLVDGYSRGEFDRVWITWRIDSFGPSGDRFVMAEAGSVDTELAPQDKNWRPIIRHSPAIPGHAEEGLYTVTVRVTDELKPVTVERKVAIRVHGESVSPGRELTIRRFVLTRTEGGAPYEQALFRPGDTIWGEFFITGYQLTETNSFDVHATLQFLDNEGKVLFNFRPQDEQGAPFYPRRWLPATFRLDLDKTLLPGRYQIALRINDRLGEQTYEERKTFGVE
ncbi:MAG: hypothetical protein OXB98_04935 [Bryobacterales bacterium]|nr:hypothetical protein [Bryobacterales bacterium]